LLSIVNIKWFTSDKISDNHCSIQFNTDGNMCSLEKRWLSNRKSQRKKKEKAKYKYQFRMFWLSDKFLLL